jgi:hypothetical protein
LIVKKSFYSPQSRKVRKAENICWRPELVCSIPPLTGLNKNNSLCALRDFAVKPAFQKAKLTLFLILPVK